MEENRELELNIKMKKKSSVQDSIGAYINKNFDSQRLGLIVEKVGNWVTLFALNHGLRER